MKTIRYLTLGTLCVLIFSAGLSSCSPVSDTAVQFSDDLIFSVDSGTYEDEVLVSIVSAVDGAEIRYTLDGTDPDDSSDLYYGPILIPAYGEEVQLKAAIFLEGARGCPKTVGKKYTVSCKGRVATPKMSLPKGVYQGAITVKINCATEGAEIRYTMDGSKPDASSPLYGEPLVLEPGTVTAVRAIALKKGMKNSEPESIRYVVQPKIADECEILFKSKRDLMQELDPENGDSVVAYVRELYKMKADGSDQTRMTNAVFSYLYEKFMDFAGDASWSPDRKKIVYSYDACGLEVGGSVYLIENDGSYRIKLKETIDGSNFIPSWSPDGKQILLTDDNSIELKNAGYFLLSPDGTELANILPGEGKYMITCKLSWSPDSRKLMFEMDARIWAMSVDGKDVTVLPGQTTENFDPDWHPFKDKVVYSAKVDGQYDIFIMNIDGTSKINLTNSSANETEPVWSPDGKKIAYTTDADGNLEIYVMNADGGCRKNISNHPADDWAPIW